MDDFFDGLTDWWSTVSPEFAFLLALPFVIAALCLVADRLRSERERTPRGQAAPPRRFSRRAARLHH